MTDEVKQASLAECNRHLFANVRPESRGQALPTDNVAKRAKKAAPVILGDDQLATEAKE